MDHVYVIEINRREIRVHEYSSRSCFVSNTGLKSISFRRFGSSGVERESFAILGKKGVAILEYFSVQ